MSVFCKKRKHRIMKALLPITLIMTLVSLYGCGQVSESESVIGDKEQEQAKADPALGLSIDVPISTPSILVDQMGYRTGSEKIVVFKGENVPDTFEIRRVDNNKNVYTGKISGKTFNSTLSEYDSYGTFTEFQSDGEYYIYTDTAGSSYSFVISENVYDDVFKNALKQYYYNRCGMALTDEYAGTHAHGVCHTKEASLVGDGSTLLDVTGGWHLDENANRDVQTGAEIVSNLLFAYEMNTDAFTEEMDIPESGNGIPDILDEVKYETDWMLKMQDNTTGAVYTSANTEASNSDNLLSSSVVITAATNDATISFVTAEAKTGYMYRNIDENYSAKCIEAADKAYDNYCESADPKTDTKAFYAAAELYRATGDKKYEKLLSYFFSQSTFISGFSKDENLLLGSITYLMTSKPVNSSVCSNLMEAIMDNASGILSRADKSRYYVADEDISDTKNLLFEMKFLTVADHIMYSHEYTQVIENHVHFLMGRNTRAIDLIDEDAQHSFQSIDDTVGITNQPVSDSEFIVILSTLMK